MTQETGTPDASWYQALRLRERLPASIDLLRELPFDRARAAKRIERWRAQPPFSNDGYLDRRLAADGLDEPGLLALLGEEAESLRQWYGAIPGWLEEIQAAFTAGPADPLPWPGEHSPEAGGSAAFLVMTEPLVRRSCERLRAGIADLALRTPQGLEIDPDSTVRDLLGRLAPDLASSLKGFIITKQSFRIIPSLEIMYPAPWRCHQTLPQETRHEEEHEDHRSVAQRGALSQLERGREGRSAGASFRPDRHRG